MVDRSGPPELREAFAARARATLYETLDRLVARGAHIEMFELHPWSSRDVLRLELRLGFTLPWDFRAYLELVGSGGLIWEQGEREGGFVVKDVDEIADTGDLLAPYWHCRWRVPFLGYGSRYVALVDAATGQVMELDAYDADRRKLLAPSWRAWFDRCAAVDFEHL